MITSNPPRKEILIIDDDETLVMVMSRTLKRRGYNVFTAKNGEEALAQIKAHKPNCISLDLKLDQETGLKLIPQILALTPQACIVMLTAYASIATAVDAIKLGAHQYLCKPVDIDQLLNAFEFSNDATPNPIQEKPTSVKRLEWEAIQQALQANDGNVSATARELGMHRRTLQRKLLKHPVKN